MTLIARGLIRVALCIFFIVVIMKALSSDELSVFTAKSGRAHVLATIMIVGLVVVGIIGALSAVIGFLDLVPRRTVSGTVVSLKDRKLLDVLPPLAQQLLFERNPNEIDKRRVRTEVVLSTHRGHQQWTVRKTAVLRELTIGASVALTVTPISGYVAQATRIPHPYSPTL